MTVTFFGHRDTPSTIRPKLTETLISLIVEHGADTFYIGNNGAFDSLATSVLKELVTNYPHVRYMIVLSKLPTTANESDVAYYENTIIFDGFEKAHPKYAIVKRNEFMINNADTVVSYVKYTSGGAYRFTELAKKKKKTVVNLAE